MKLEYVLVILFLLCTGGIGLAMDLPAEGGAVSGTNKYHLAYVDVKDTAHNYEVGKEPERNVAAERRRKPAADAAI